MDKQQQLVASMPEFDGYRVPVDSLTDDVICQLDTEGLVPSWNPGAQRLTGYFPSENRGEHFSRCRAAEERWCREPDWALGTARREGRLTRDRWRVQKGGSRFWASVVIDPIHNDAGALIGFAKGTRDLTERKAVERELECARQALFQSQKMDALGQLTDGVAHDFNNLLMTVSNGPICAPSEAVALSQDRKLTILAVNDDSLVPTNTVALLEDLGHEVFAWSGQEALAIFDREPRIGLIITDQAMPYMTGAQLVAGILARRPRFPVILATGHGELTEELSGKVLKLCKPFGHAELARAVAMVMSQEAVAGRMTDHLAAR
jgi:PAS domain S-box-containing protein